MKDVYYICNQVLHLKFTEQLSVFVVTSQLAILLVDSRKGLGFPIESADNAFVVKMTPVLM